MSAAVDVTAVKKQADEVYAWQKRLEEATKHLEGVRALNGQSGYSVTIGGRTLTVAKIQDRTYMAKMMRGMEMVHLGALKALGAEIDEIKRRLYTESEKLAVIASVGGAA